MQPEELRRRKKKKGLEKKGVKLQVKGDQLVENTPKGVSQQFTPGMCNKETEGQRVESLPLERKRKKPWVSGGAQSGGGGGRGEKTD